MAHNCQWHRIDGVWYEVVLRMLDNRGQRTGAYDVVLRRTVDGRQRELLHARYGDPGVYAFAKRQLGRPALRANGLHSDAE